MLGDHALAIDAANGPVVDDERKKKTWTVIRHARQLAPALTAILLAITVIEPTLGR
jgi:hypothetical protein